MNPTIQNTPTTETDFVVVETQTLHPDKEDVRLFASGVNGIKPAGPIVRMAANIARQAIALLTEPEIDFDDEDGSLNFDLRLNNGHTMFIELYPDGRLFLGVYDERVQGDSETILLMDNPSEKQIIELFGEKQ